MFTHNGLFILILITLMDAVFMNEEMDFEMISKYD